MKANAPTGTIANLQGLIQTIVPPLADPTNGFALLDFPDYSNVGDSLIWLGELRFFKDRFNTVPSYVSTLSRFDVAAFERAVPAGPIYLSGGGNFGDLWPRFQLFRNNLLSQFPSRRIVQLPQTIKFENSDILAQTRDAIKQHGNFVLLVRDTQSLDFAKSQFECDVHLCPDMAFCLGPIAADNQAPEFDAVYLLRTDKEGSITPNERARLPIGNNLICDWLEDKKVTESKRRLTLSAPLKIGRLLGLKNPAGPIYRIYSEKEMRRGVQLLRRGKVVVTDRLHTHILSVLLGKPHAVVDNSYGKISGFMKAWTGGDPLVYSARSLDDANEWVRSRVARGS